jgi:hypothetical protein
MAPVKTIEGIFQALSFVAARIHESAQQPYSMKFARYNLWTWAAVASCAGLALVMEAIETSYKGQWWSWWYLWNGTIFVVDLIMLRASLVGYAYRHRVDAEKAEFERIVADI